MARFFTADLHLGHRNIARYEPERARAAGVPPLTGSADDATQARLDGFLIDRWNEVVGPDDEVWLLGDAVVGRLDHTISLLGGLVGRIVLVPGNHDRVWAGDRRRDEWWERYLAAGIDEIVDATASIELADGTVVDVDHFPYRGDSGPGDRYLDWRPEDRGRVLLHGHVHSTWRTNGRMLNVGVDVWDHAPVAEQQVIALAVAARRGGGARSASSCPRWAARGGEIAGEGRSEAVEWLAPGKSPHRDERGWSAVPALIEPPRRGRRTTDLDVPGAADDPRADDPPGEPTADGAPVDRPLVVSLDDAAALDPALVGGKAAALARARRAGIDTLPGVVLTTELSRRFDAGAGLADLVAPDVVDVTTGATADLDLDPTVGGTADLGPTADDPTVRTADHPTVPTAAGPADGSTAEVAGRTVDDSILAAVRGLGDGALAVRSSSVVEDTTESSAAGQFESVLGVRGDDGLVTAVEEVLASRERAGAATEPIGVLVQPMVEPDRAGVAFGVDPVTGRVDRKVITAVRGSPAGLVAGEVDGGRWLLDEHDTVLAHEDRDAVMLAPALRRGLADLLRRLEAELGGPQDVEWAQVGDRLVLLQSRPVTTVVRGVPEGPVYGPGPVAETFPEALAPLEEDLWLPPLRDAVREAIRITGSVAARRLEGRELVVAVGGRVAIDLEVTGEQPVEGWWRLGVGDRVRRLRSAWRVGRLRVALPLMADDLARRIDVDLEDVPGLEELTVRQLVALIDRGREALRSLHAHEILLGLVADPAASRFSGASVALRVLAEARLEGLSDDEITRRAPVVLALVPPRVGRPLRLPSEASAVDLAYDPPGCPDAQVRREALRLRVRWVQELVGQAAHEVGRRLAQRGVVSRAADVRFLRLDEVTALVVGRALVDRRLLARRAAAHRASPALPARFRVSDRGLAIAVEGPAGETGTGAGGGVGEGPVTHDVDDPAQGSVLVVGALTPGLGPLLPRLAGLVSETGSVLSHLAILAREAEVPVVVGRPGATTDLVDGSRVRVDGQTGAVAVVAEVAEVAEAEVAGADEPVRTEEAP